MGLPTWHYGSLPGACICVDGSCGRCFHGPSHCSHRIYDILKRFRIPSAGLALGPSHRSRCLQGILYCPLSPENPNSLHGNAMLALCTHSASLRQGTLKRFQLRSHQPIPPKACMNARCIILLWWIVWRSPSRRQTRVGTDLPAEAVLWYALCPIQCPCPPIAGPYFGCIPSGFGCICKLACWQSGATWWIVFRHGIASMAILIHKLCSPLVLPMHGGDIFCDHLFLHHSSSSFTRSYPIWPPWGWWGFCTGRLKWCCRARSTAFV